MRQEAGLSLALKQLGDEKLGVGLTFVLKSRQKHSAYKECFDCQTKRLAIAKAIADRPPLAEIQQRQKDLADHVQWFMQQRRVLYVPGNQSATVPLRVPPQQPYGSLRKI